MMQRIRQIPALIAMLLLLCVSAPVLSAQTTAFSYQGRLNDGGNPANGTYDLTFTLYNSSNVPGQVVAGPLTNPATTISNGLFAVTLDFGANVFTGSNYWLAIGVRTNGAGAFSTLAPRSPIQSVPYAIMANSASNLLGTVAAGQITGALPASQVSGTLSLAQLPGSVLTNAAAFDAAGAASNATNALTNVLVRSGWAVGQQSSPSRLPILGVAGYYGAFDDATWTNRNGVTGISNAEVAMDQYLAPFGYRYIVLDDGWGQTNLDANGLEQLSSGIAPSFSGVADFIHHFHTNNNKIGLYFDGVSGTNQLSTGGFQHAIGPPLLYPNINAVAAAGVDYIKFDTTEANGEMAAYALATNGSPVFLSGAVDPAFDDDGYGPLPAVYPAMFNSFRVVFVGDINSFFRLTQWTDVLMTNNWWKYVSPGHFIDMDYIAEARDVGPNGLKYHLIICALFSAPIYEDDSFISGPRSWFTNVDLLAINQDPAVICAQRYVQTNNCDVYLKPLGSQNGPQYALGILNRSGAPATVAFAFTNLPPLLASSIANWSAYDCVSNTGWISQNANGFSVQLPPFDSVLWKLTPGYALQTNIVAVNWPHSVSMSVVSNGVPLTCYGPWDADASNYVFRAGLTNNTAETLAAAVAVSVGKQHGWWNNLDALYLFRGGTPNACAQNLISTNYNIQWSASGMTFSWTGVTGDGTSGYGDTGFNPALAHGHFQTNSASMFVYNRTPLPVNLSGKGVFMGAEPGNRSGIWNSGTVYGLDGINGTIGSIAINSINTDQDTGDFTGYFVGTRTASTFQTVYHDTQINNPSDTTPTTGMPNSDIWILSDDEPGNGRPTGCTLSLAGFGGGMTASQWIAFRNDLVTIESIINP